MEIYYSEHGARNPCFRYVIKVKKVSKQAQEWLKEYPSSSRYWIDHTSALRTGSGLVNVQFEDQEPATMFALRWA